MLLVLSASATLALAADEFCGEIEIHVRFGGARRCSYRKTKFCSSKNGSRATRERWALVEVPICAIATSRAAQFQVRRRAAVGQLYKKTFAIRNE